ncbi:MULTISPECIES: Crp/Fnr family transcriptional regulator [unclassified Pseudomonas]|uniref:Crp/Fnr family transcriptional regulator n=1 Tax=unclassified Pseudomonas TaxID=196821 RepID=UPI00244938E0|nr:MULTISPECIES: Crp/Fnr family transcriptional regulator [unclassified Pseudomonas]MDG9929000.1 Crp/Fnr family transcriptional regulator [Pseudomonas sp. GD04042]MDH0483831.1 Crp/Fnr family transcriptional regulator [Pseudomonas sp. GD04015]MDH0604326.1 Crp/Fnr family transcriptional regulator [Pseudomonas sp. GD03869]
MSGFNWVEDLAPSIRKALFEKARIKTFPDGATIYAQGDPVSDVFQIISGEIRQCILTEDGQEVLVYIYKPGDLVGDSSVVDDDPYSVTILARGEVATRAWSIKDFAALRATHHEIESAISAQSSRRLRGALKLIEELLTQPVAARVASRFLRLSEMGESSIEGADLSLSQADIGLMVGTTRQSVNRVVTELRKLGLIETDYGKIIIKDLEGLKRYIGEHQRHGRGESSEH